jgi:hypothetical protein
MLLAESWPRMLTEGVSIAKATRQVATWTEKLAAIVPGKLTKCSNERDYWQDVATRAVSASEQPVSTAQTPRRGWTR